MILCALQQNALRAGGATAAAQHSTEKRRRAGSKRCCLQAPPASCAGGQAVRAKRRGAQPAAEREAGGRERVRGPRRSISQAAHTRTHTFTHTHSHINTQINTHTHTHTRARACGAHSPAGVAFPAARLGSPSCPGGGAGAALAVGAQGRACCLQGCGPSSTGAVVSPLKGLGYWLPAQELGGPPALLQGAWCSGAPLLVPTEAPERGRLRAAERSAPRQHAARVHAASMECLRRGMQPHGAAPRTWWKAKGGWPRHAAWGRPRCRGHAVRRRLLLRLLLLWRWLLRLLRLQWGTGEGSAHMGRGRAAVHGVGHPGGAGHPTLCVRASGRACM